MDWLGTTFGIIGAWLNAKDARAATIIWLISNIAFIIWSAYTGTYSILALQVVYFFINSRTLYVRWKEGTK